MGDPDFVSHLTRKRMGGRVYPWRKQRSYHTNGGCRGVVKRSRPRMKWGKKTYDKTRWY